MSQIFMKSTQPFKVGSAAIEPQNLNDGLLPAYGMCEIHPLVDKRQKLCSHFKPIY